MTKKGVDTGQMTIWVFSARSKDFVTKRKDRNEKIERISKVDMGML